MDIKEQVFRSLDFSKAYNRVVQWNALARDGKHNFKEETIEFQKTLVVEESEELEEGFEKASKLEVIDALCDMFVVGSYWHYLQNDGRPLGFIAKSALHGVDYTNQIKFMIQHDSSFLYLDSVCTLLYQFNGDPMGALNEVMDSNDSKFPLVSKKDKQEVILLDNGDTYTPEAMCKWIEENCGGRYTGVTHKIVKGTDGQRRYVFLSDKGKIVKPATFFEPDLAKFI